MQSPCLTCFSISSRRLAACRCRSRASRRSTTVSLKASHLRGRGAGLHMSSRGEPQALAVHQPGQHCHARSLTPAPHRRTSAQPHTCTNTYMSMLTAVHAPCTEACTRVPCCDAGAHLTAAASAHHDGAYAAWPCAACQRRTARPQDPGCARTVLVCARRAPRHATWRARQHFVGAQSCWP